VSAPRKVRRSRVAAATPAATTTHVVANSLQRAIGLKLSVIAHQLRQRFDQAVEHDGLSRAKWRVIVAVARNPGTTQRAIAAMLEITEVTAGHLIDKLSGDGYLERREHPTDRRAYRIHLTPASQPLLARLEEVAKIHEEETFADLSADDLASLNGLLDRIAHNLTAARQRLGANKARAAGAAGND